MFYLMNLYPTVQKLNVNDFNIVGSKPHFPIIRVFSNTGAIYRKSGAYRRHTRNCSVASVDRKVAFARGSAVIDQSRSKKHTVHIRRT